MKKRFKTESHAEERSIFDRQTLVRRGVTNKNAGLTPLERGTARGQFGGVFR